MRTQLIALLLAVAGIILLFLTPLPEKAGGVVVEGTVKSVWKTGNVYHLTLQPKPALKIVSFGKAPSKGANITAVARLQQYKAKPELVLESWDD